MIPISVAIAQLMECLAGKEEDPSSIPRKGEKNFHLNLFLRGNEPNGEQEQEEQEQQLK